MRTRHLDFPRRSTCPSVVVGNLMRYEKPRTKTTGRRDREANDSLKHEKSKKVGASLADPDEVMQGAAQAGLNGPGMDSFGCLKLKSNLREDVNTVTADLENKSLKVAAVRTKAWCSVDKASSRSWGPGVLKSADEYQSRDLIDRSFNSLRTGFAVAKPATFEKETEDETTSFILPVLEPIFRKDEELQPILFPSSCQLNFHWP
ncbi:hypothetical protein C8J57DRAFT_1464906 [Mycena rebaudengoi]|nr:hypothetical protein C8J57DRAFT_1464906 [Mycena rebaudengoi]